MGTVLLIIIPLIGYVVAYFTYGKYLSEKVFKLDKNIKCPSENLRDDIDFIPTKKQILFGHHFTTIAGLGPIIGPAVGIIWGWLPALLWVFFGSILMGAVHDFGALIISMRNKGTSIGDLAINFIGKRASILFQLIIFLALLMVIAIFALVISALFLKYPESVLPVWGQIPIAIALGLLIYKMNANPILMGIIAVIIMYATIYLGSMYPIDLSTTQDIIVNGSTIVQTTIMGLNPIVFWMVVLLIYVFFASIIPVQILLQPRDYINSYQLIIAMVLISLSILVAQPVLSAPAISSFDVGIDMFPFLFVIIACGAISGFHSLASSGTTSKQCASELDAKFIGYGSMLTEGFLAILVIACIAGGMGYGLESSKATELFNSHYANIKTVTAGGLSSKLSGFISGATNMMSSLSIPKAFATTILGVFLVSFAATTLDSATRIQRYVIAELAKCFNLKLLSGKYVATLIAVGSAFLLIFLGGGGFDKDAAVKGAKLLWPLFGCINQLLASLALLIITLYLAKKKSNFLISLIPMILIMFITGWALISKTLSFYNSANWLLFGLGLSIFILEIWMIIESFMVIFTSKPKSVN